MSLNEPRQKSRATIIRGKFVSKPKSNSHWLIFLENFFHWSKFKAHSHNVFFSWTFDLLLINCRYLIIAVYSHHTKEIFKGNQSWNTNHELVSETDAQKTCFSCKIKTLYVSIFNLSQFHEHIFRSSRLQMLFKIGSLKNFAILRIKKRL